MLASPLPPSFLDTYSLSTSYLECNALCLVISFLVLWSICLSSILVNFKKGPEYLTRVTARVFIPLIRFPSRVEIFFLNFVLYLHLFDGVIFQDGHVFVRFFFSEPSNLVFIWQFRSLCQVSFAAFHYSHDTFFYTEFHPYVFTVYSHCVF